MLLDPGTWRRAATSRGEQGKRVTDAKFGGAGRTEAHGRERRVGGGLYSPQGDGQGHLRTDSPGSFSAEICFLSLSRISKRLYPQSSLFAGLSRLGALHTV